MIEYFKLIDKKIIMTPVALSVVNKDVTEDLRQTMVDNFKEQIALMDFRDKVKITSDFSILKCLLTISGGVATKLRYDEYAHVTALRIAKEVMRRRSMDYIVKEIEEKDGSLSFSVICRTHRKLIDM